MKRVRLTVDPGDADLPETFERATADDRIDRVRVVNWNVATDPAAFLLRVEGERRPFEAFLRADPDVDGFETLPLADDEWYCFVRGVGTPAARALWAQFKRGSLLTVPPAEWNDDGTYTFTVVGADEHVQAAVDTVPDPASATVEAVGRPTIAAERVLDRLTDRQRAAVEAAIDRGYYDVPRDATAADVARDLGCAPSTAAEHLQKAEATVLRGLLG